MDFNLPYNIKEKSLIAKLAALKLGVKSIAMVFGKTIHLYNVSSIEFIKNEAWLKHELCHVRQFKKYGFFNFLLKYTWESIKHGYANNKFEIEAREAETIL